MRGCTLKSRSDKGPQTFSKLALANSDIVPPTDPWDAVFGAHRWLLPRPPRLYDELWEATVGRRDEIWAAALATIESEAPPAPSVSAPDMLDPMWFVHDLRRCRTRGEMRAVFRRLEGLWLHERDWFAAWVAQLVYEHEVQSLGPRYGAHDPRRSTDRGLLYEILLRQLRRVDRHVRGHPRLSVRFAAMLDAFLRGPSPWGWFERLTLDPIRRYLYEFTARWKGYREDCDLVQLPRRPVFRVLLIPGRSPSGDEDATEAAAARVTNALPDIEAHRAEVPPGEVLLIVLSGGQVRSFVSEAESMHAALLAAYPAGLPANVEVVCDNLARHTSNNLRAAGQVALRCGLRGFWVQTGMSHALVKLMTDWAPRYWRETSWGLTREDDFRTRLIPPMFRLLSGPGTNPLGGRAHFVDLRPVVFVPAIGDALNP